MPLPKKVATFIVQKILLEVTGLNFVCATAKCFYAVSIVLEMRSPCWWSIPASISWNILWDVIFAWLTIRVLMRHWRHAFLLPSRMEPLDHICTMIQLYRNGCRSSCRLWVRRKTLEVMDQTLCWLVNQEPLAQIDHKRNKSIHRFAQAQRENE
jgi:hypothetical protein